jgi:hypothetical protein
VRRLGEKARIVEAVLRQRKAGVVPELEHVHVVGFDRVEAPQHDLAQRCGADIDVFLAGPAVVVVADHGLGKVVGVRAEILPAPDADVADDFDAARVEPLHVARVGFSLRPAPPRKK